MFFGYVEISNMEMKPESEPLDDLFGWRMHDKYSPDHSGQYGHYCMDFDGLWICKDCSDFACCTCLTDADKAYFDAPSIPISEEEREQMISKICKESK